MSTTSTQNTVQLIRDTEATAVRLFSAVTASLATVDKKGNRVSFERSIAFASKDARQGMTGAIYAKQCSAGRYTRLVRDSLEAGVLNKQQRELFEAMVGHGDANKDTTQRYCAAVVHMDDNANAAGKPAKGQKKFFIGMLRELHASFAADARTESAPAGSVTEAEVSTVG